MTKYHIQGMGLMGSLVAMTLEDEGLDFTWDDIDRDITAWHASTGAVFPTEDAHSEYRSFIQFRQEESVAGEHLLEHSELGAWCYVAENPPHGGADIGVEEVTRISESEVRVSSHASIHVNVANLVRDARARYGDRRREKASSKRRLIVSHGFDAAKRFGWGWHREVQLVLSDEFEQALMGTRPCIYLRKGYQIMYIYPMPGTDSYFIGTSNNIGTTPKWKEQQEVINKDFGRVRKRVEETCGDHVQLLRARPPSQGWRPYPAKGDDRPMVYEEDSHLQIKPQKGSGLRFWPRTRTELLEAL